MMETSDWPKAPYRVESSDLHGKAELRRGDAVVVHQLIQAAILLVGAYILQSRGGLSSALSRIGPHLVRSCTLSDWIVY